MGNTPSITPRTSRLRRALTPAAASLATATLVASVPLGLGALTPASAAPHGPGSGPDVSAARDWVFPADSDSGMRVVELAPGIGLSNRTYVGGKLAAALSMSERQTAAEKVSSYLETMRSTTSGKRLLDSVTRLLSPTASDTWRRTPLGRGRSEDQVVLIVSDRARAHSLGDSDAGNGVGTGSLVELPRKLWEGGVTTAYVDTIHPSPYTHIPAQVVHHELFHSTQFLSGASSNAADLPVPTPFYENWSRPLKATTDIRMVNVPVDEIFAHGGRIGLASARRVLTAKRDGSAAEFAASEFSDLSINPLFARAADHARETAKSSGRDAPLWLDVAQARGILAQDPPTELQFAGELNMPNRPEYSPERIAIAPGRWTNKVWIRTSGELTPADARDLVSSSKASPLYGTWDHPFETPGTALPGVPCR